MRTFYLVFGFLFVLSYGSAQSYGGSAFVKVEDDEGRSYFETAATFCTHRSESSAKAELKRDLERGRHYSEKFISGISYNIDRCSDNDDNQYGGTAWVKVSNSDGETRVLNTDVPCIQEDKAYARYELRRYLERLQKSVDGEVFISKINYDISSCD